MNHSKTMKTLTLCFCLALMSVFTEAAPLQSATIPLWGGFKLTGLSNLSINPFVYLPLTDLRSRLDGDLLSRYGKGLAQLQGDVTLSVAILAGDLALGIEIRGFSPDSRCLRVRVGTGPTPTSRSLDFSNVYYLMKTLSDWYVDWATYLPKEAIDEIKATEFAQVHVTLVGKGQLSLSAWARPAGGYRQLILLPTVMFAAIDNPEQSVGIRLREPQSKPLEGTSEVLICDTAGPKPTPEQAKQLLRFLGEKDE